MLNNCQVAVTVDHLCVGLNSQLPLIAAALQKTLRLMSGVSDVTVRENAVTRLRSGQPVVVNCHVTVPKVADVDVRFGRGSSVGQSLIDPNLQDMLDAELLLVSGLASCVTDIRSSIQVALSREAPGLIVASSAGLNLAFRGTFGQNVDYYDVIADGNIAPAAVVSMTLTETPIAFTPTISICRTTLEGPWEFPNGTSNLVGDRLPFKGKWKSTKTATVNEGGVNATFITEYLTDPVTLVGKKNGIAITPFVSVDNAETLPFVRALNQQAVRIPTNRPTERWEGVTFLEDSQPSFTEQKQYRDILALGTAINFVGDVTEVLEFTNTTGSQINSGQMVGLLGSFAFAPVSEEV